MRQKHKDAVSQFCATSYSHVFSQIIFFNDNRISQPDLLELDDWMISELYIKLKVLQGWFCPQRGQSYYQVLLEQKTCHKKPEIWDSHCIMRMDFLKVWAEYLRYLRWNLRHKDLLLALAMQNFSTELNVIICIANAIAIAKSSVCNVHQITLYLLWPQIFQWIIINIFKCGKSTINILKILSFVSNIFIYRKLNCGLSRKQWILYLQLYLLVCVPGVIAMRPG